jgi:PPE-repeat protein
MYTGPGSGSLSTAAASWDSLAAELSTTAETYESVISSLNTLHWRGPAAAAMTATVAPYVGWLYTTAEQTQQTAMQARAAAMAFEQAYTMTVPPPLIAANRAQLTALIATNFFGQNTAAIAATEEQYAEMWAQDATAMYGYACSSVAATTTLTPFAPPQQTTNPAGLTAQSAAVAQAKSSAAATDPMSQLIAFLT